jgi:Cytosine deaminase and related metal-dependent hydrolases
MRSPAAGDRHRREGRPHRRDRAAAGRQRPGTGAGGGRLVCAGFVETHIHLDKSCILARCDGETQRFPHLAMERVSAVKHSFTVEDVSARAATIEKCIGHGATRMRTHVEVDPKDRAARLEGVRALIDRYRWAIDLEICVMPQEGLLNNPGTDELMVAALKAGATVVGAAPNYDTDRPGPDPPRLRDGARIRRRHRHASRQRRLGRGARHPAGLRSHREVRLGRARRHRARL